ncbi:hypothetical protein L1987_00015 [Smallanthus sonchifolius]|uniref:Uncharacterized protein n=1 Tax=Smallanthus sonchifolius TaxID=185202 RepID=A0ACB9K0Y6_9ASTR|nr:hypothetical protein L1987_00015 [Smallanthus sonchifolius]
MLYRPSTARDFMTHAIPDGDRIHHRALGFKSLGDLYYVCLCDGFVKDAEFYHRMVWFEKAFLKGVHKIKRLKDELDKIMEYKLNLLKELSALDEKQDESASR